jgi:hypothetical protein
VKHTTWVPAAIGIGDATDDSGMKSLVLQDGAETLIIPLADGDARRIGAALLDVEIPDTLEHPVQ